MGTMREKTWSQLTPKQRLDYEPHLELLLSPERFEALLYDEVDVRAVAWEIKEEYENARSILRQDPDAFVQYHLQAMKQGNDFRKRLCRKVQEDAGGGWIRRVYASGLHGPLHILRLVQGRGNPNLERIDLDAATVAQRAQELTTGPTWRKYVPKRRNPKTKYAQALLKDLASEFGVSVTMVYKRLREGQWVPPVKCRYPLP